MKEGEKKVEEAAAKMGIYGNDAVEAMYPFTKTIADGSSADSGPWLRLEALTW